MGNSNYSFWDTIRGVRLADTLTRNMPKIEELTNAVRDLTHELEKLNRAEKAARRNEAENE